MNKVSRYSWNAALALTLTLGSSVILAKGPGTHSPQDQAKVEYRCSSTAGSTGATAKSPNGHFVLFLRTRGFGPDNHPAGHHYRQNAWQAGWPPAHP